MFKFKFNEKMVAELEAKVTKDVKEILSSAEMLGEVGKMTADRLRFQARTEKPFNTTGGLPLLKESTIRNREYLAKHNQTHPTFESGLSNLTITGKFLDALTYMVKGPGRIDLYFEGIHPGYRGKNGPLKGKKPKNQDIFRWLTQKGFVVFDQSLEQNKVFKNRVKSIVLRFIRRGLKVRSQLE